jgi:hypothetical protein
MDAEFSYGTVFRANRAAARRSCGRKSGTFFGQGNVSGHDAQKNLVAVSAAFAEQPKPSANRVKSFQLSPTRVPSVFSSKSIAAQ